MDISTIGLRVDSTQLKTAESGLNKFATAGDRAETSAQSVTTATREMSREQGRIASVSGAAQSAMQNASVASAAFGSANRSSAAHTANLTAQLNDIGVMLAAGQNPLQLAVQQGTQINQVFAQMGGGASALRGIGTALISMINPLSIATLGVIAFGAYGVKALMGLRGEAIKLEDRIDAVSDALNRQSSAADAAGQSSDELRQKYGNFADVMQSTLELLSATATAEAQRQIDGLSQSLAELLGTAGAGESRAVLADFFDVNIGLAFSKAAREARAEARGMTAEFQNAQAALAASNGNLEQQIVATRAMLQSAIELAEAKDGISASEAKIISELSAGLDLMVQQKEATAETAKGAYDAYLGYQSLRKEGEKANASAQELLATLKAEANLQSAILAYGRDSSQVARLRADAERANFAASLDTLGVSETMRDTLMGAFLVTQDLTAENDRAANAASAAASAAGGLSGNIAQASAFAAQLVANLGQVPAAIAAIGAQVDSAIGALQSQNSSLTYQLEQGLTASAAAIKTQRDEALKLAAANGASIDQMAALGQSFDEQAAKAEALSQANSGMSQTLADQAAAADKSGSATKKKTGTTKAATAASREAAKALKEQERAQELLREEIERLEFDADPIKKYAAALKDLELLKDGGLSDGAYAKAVADLNDELAQSYPLIGDVSDAFGDFVAGGLKDFKGFVSSILGSFKAMLSEMIATAARNQIMISMGLGGSGGIAGGATSMLGSFGGGTGLAGLAGGSGLMGGLGNALGGGLGNVLNIGGNAAAAGGGALATLGAALPIIGGVAAAIGFFSTKTKELDAGIRLNIQGNDLLAESYRKVEKSRYFGLSKSQSTSFSAMESGPYQQAYASVYGGIADLANTFNIGAKSLQGYSKSLKISTEGMDEAAAQQEVLNRLQEVNNDLAQIALGRLGGEGVDSRALFQRAGETSSDTLARLSASLQTANSALDLLGGTLLPLGKNGTLAAVAMADAAGGVEGLASSVGSYYENFYSAEEKLVNLTRQFYDEANKLNVGYVPRLADNFRAKVDKLLADGETEAAAALIAMSPMVTSMASYREEISKTTTAAKDAANSLKQLGKDQRQNLYTQILELTGQTDKLRARELAALEPNARASQLRVWALQDEAAAATEAAQAAASLAAAQQAVADERLGIQRQIWSLMGNEKALRADVLSGLDASNVALQKQFWALSDQKDAQEALAQAADEATAAIQAMIDAVDPAKFATRFDYERALGQAGAGLSSSRTTATGVPLVSVPASSPAAQQNAAMVKELVDLRDQLKALVALTVNSNADVRKIRQNSDRDQAIGIPRTRTAS